MKQSRLWLYGVLIFLAAFAVYFQVRHFDFVNYDDGLYVYDSPWVKAGITPGGLKWLLGANVCSNWHPLTVFSHMMDVELFGLNPAAHHIVNVLIHAVNSVLLFALFAWLTGSAGNAFLLGLLFAVHPLHVESVAWISERKDVLSAMFWILGLWSWALWHRSGKIRHYLLTLLLFVFGLLTKPMMVTFPLALLLMDVWPLQRISAKAVREKIPFFVLTAVFCVITLAAQKKSIVSFTKYPLDIRFFNAIVSYVLYIAKTFWPSKLAVIYPYPESIPMWKVLSSSVLLAAASIFAVFKIRRMPWLFMGWFWFVLTLVPVIGIIQVGSQAMADRYAYLPHIGFFIAVIWSLDELLKRWKVPGVLVAGVSAAAVLALSVVTWQQVSFWKSSTALFERAIAVTRDNFMAHNNLGLAYFKSGRHEEAIQHYARSISIRPYRNKAYDSMGQVLGEQGKMEEAIAYYLKSIATNPANAAESYFNLGVICGMQGRNDKAEFYYREALKLNPSDLDARNNLGNLLMRLGRLQESREAFQQVVSENPYYERAYFGMGDLAAKENNFEEAKRNFRKAIEIRPDYEKAKKRLEEISNA